MKDRRKLARTMVLLLALSGLATGSQQQSPAQRLQELQDKAEHASEKDQCRFYAEVIRELVEVINLQIGANDFDKAQQSSKDVITYAEKCRAAAHKSNHKLKEAEITLRKAERRLDDLQHVVPLDDRPPVKAAVDRISAVRTEILQQMFKR